MAENGEKLPFGKAELFAMNLNHYMFQLFFKYLACILCLRKRAAKLLQEHQDEISQPMLPITDKQSLTDPAQNPLQQQQCDDNGTKATVLASQDEIIQLKDAVKAGSPKAATHAQQQWKMITLLLDRLCAITFFIINVIVVLVLLPLPSTEWMQKK